MYLIQYVWFLVKLHYFKATIWHTKIMTLLPSRSINTHSYYWIFVVYHLVNLCKCSIVSVYLIINNNQNGVEKASSFFINLFLADSPEFSSKWIIKALWYTDDCLAVLKLVIDDHHSVALLWMWPSPQKKKNSSTSQMRTLSIHSRDLSVLKHAHFLHYTGAIMLLRTQL